MAQPDALRQAQALRLGGRFGLNYSKCNPLKSRNASKMERLQQTGFLEIPIRLNLRAQFHQHHVETKMAR